MNTVHTQTAAGFAALVAMTLAWAPTAIAEPASATTASTQPAYPHVWLSDGQVRLLVYLPDAKTGYYRSSRFDWSGMIGRAEYGGHTFFGEWNAAHDPTVETHGIGTAEEFGMEQPLGFDEAKPGEPFVKIGVGLVARRDRRPYRFYNPHKVLQPGQWQIEHGPDWITFRQDFAGVRGWAYRYEKRIKIQADPAGFVIVHLLENTGTKAIDTNHYNHSFVIIDDAPIDDRYHFVFPFKAASRRDDPNAKVRYEGNSIIIESWVDPEGIWLDLAGLQHTVAENRATVMNLRTGAGIAFEGELPVERYWLWSVPTVGCVEPFVRIRLQPGQSKQWKIRYRFCVEPSAATSRKAQK